MALVGMQGQWPREGQMIRKGLEGLRPVVLFIIPKDLKNPCI